MSMIRIHCISYCRWSKKPIVATPPPNVALLYSGGGSVRKMLGHREKVYEQLSIDLQLKRIPSLETNHSVTGAGGFGLYLLYRQCSQILYESM